MLLMNAIYCQHFVSSLAPSVCLAQQHSFAYIVGMPRHKLSYNDLLSGAVADEGQGRADGERHMDQLAPGGFLYDYWDMANRPPSPAGSWSNSPTQHPGWPHHNTADN